MAIYRARLADGESFLMDFDEVQASAPILARADEDDYARWGHTGYQTADAGGSKTRAAQLVVEYWSADNTMCAEIASVTALLQRETADTDEDA